MDMWGVCLSDSELIQEILSPRLKPSAEARRNNWQPEVKFWLAPSSWVNKGSKY